jgi:hypothetical protein
MRIAGGVLLLIVGLWSLIGGGCSVFVGGAASKVSGAAAEMSAKLATEAGAKMDDEAKKALADAQAKAGSLGSGVLISGIVILVGGILCIIAGIMFFVNKGKAFGFLAPGVGIIGEIIFFVLVAFNIIGLIKILILAFTAFAATKVGAES